MALILTSWLLIYFITSVVGQGLLRLGGSEPVKRISQTEFVLAGLTGIIILVQITSLFFPTDYRMVGLLLLLTGLINGRLANEPIRVATQSLRRLARQPLVWVLVGVVLIFSLCTPGYWDAGMYHIPSIRWYERFAVIPGLGNLHGRLAFNSSYFLVSAAFGFTTFVGQTLFALNGFLMLVFGIYAIGQIRRPEAIPGLRLLHALLLGLVLYYLLYPMTSPTPDIWATLLPLFLFLFWLNGTPGTSSERFMLFMALGLVCLTVKLGTLPTLLLLPMLLLARWRSLDSKQGLLLVALGALILGPWLIRNVILSGYLLYPLSALDLFSVDWKIPLSAVHHEEGFVAFWARFHIDEAHYDPARLTWPAARWLPIWWRDQGDPATFSYFKLNRPLFVAACLSPLLMAVQGIRYGLRPSRLWVAYGVALAGLVFWFVIAPEFRFGLTFIWMTALLPWVILLGRLPLGRNAWPAAWVLGLLMVYLGFKVIRQKDPITAQAWLVPNWLSYRDMEAQGVRYRPHRTRSGLVVQMPERNVFEQRCYELEEPFPCTPYFYEDLELRGATVEDGFRRRSELQVSR